MFTVPPVRSTPPANDLVFPANQRWLMAGWNLINNPGHRLKPADGKTTEWNRGAYLVEALGHCAQCHTPRNITMGLSGKQFAGAEQADWMAYNLTSDRDHGIGGWTDDQLVQYLSTGHAEGAGRHRGRWPRPWRTACNT